MLEREGVQFRRQRLCIGDFLWVAQPRRPGGGGGGLGGGCLGAGGDGGGADGVEEGAVVLDMIVERKRADDLVGSIIGKRYTSQKHRIQESGVTRKVYLVEGSFAIDGAAAPWSKGTGCADWEVRLRSATVETEVLDGFMVFRTHDLAGTAKFLRRLTSQMAMLVEQYGVCGTSAVTIDGVPERLESFERRALAVQQRLTAGELLQLQLHAGVRGLGPAAAEALGEAFGTLAGALDAAEGCADAAAMEALTTAVLRARGSKSIGVAASARLFGLLRAAAY